MGKVFLIGAGPGDPELMTLKAARALGSADVVLIDDLVSRGCLAHARSGAKVVEVGKRGGCKSTAQAFIEKLMIQYARAGNVVARLKGGDPFVFGRGGEEMAALLAEGIEVEVIPGVTAGLAAPATLGIPVTHRELARGVTFVTGHAKEGAEADWKALARSGTTLVIYMGLARLGHIVAALLEAGLPAETPACVIQDATLKSQRELVSTLGALSAQGFESPAIIVVGAVVARGRAQAKARGDRKAA
ncbi:MAG: uroporphyrinogen-III C-methyltransferase [Betaproteobacteria bacterium]|nr:uroporphyrinogen-III C-methyltransferase [Betaproteobacteria bacterium]